MTLIEWLREQIDADERIAKDAQPEVWYRRFRQVFAETGLVLTSGERWGDDDVFHAATKADALHIAAWDPARVLAEVKAKRAILKHELDYAATIDGEWGCNCDAEKIGAGGCPGFGEHYQVFPIMFAMAQPYADRDGWRDEWSVTR